MVLTTSNLSGSIDDAFIDRADMKRFIGNPGVAARFAILHDCIAVGTERASERQELLRTGIVMGDDGTIGVCEMVMRCEDATSMPGLLRDCVLESEGTKRTRAAETPVPGVCSVVVRTNRWSERVSGGDEAEHHGRDKEWR